MSRSKVAFVGTIYIRPVCRGVNIGDKDIEDWLILEMGLNAGEIYAFGKELPGVRLTLEWESGDVGQAEQQEQEAQP